MSSTTTNTPAFAVAAAAATNSQNSTMSFYHTATDQTPLLTASNYALWSTSIQFILRAENSWQIVINTEKAPQASGLPAPSSTDESRHRISLHASIDLKKKKKKIDG